MAAFIIETGSGDPDADSLVALDYLKAWAEKRGVQTVLDADDDDLKKHLIVASEYADTFKRYKGRKAGGDQAFQFPRIELTDWSGYVITGVPRKLKEAVCYLVGQLLDGEPLYEVLDQAITSESVGPISTSYDPASNRHREFTAVDKLLAEYTRADSAVRPAPGWSQQPSTNSFGLGMQQNPSGAPLGFD